VEARRVESEYTFDRLAKVHLVQVYDLLVPQHRKALEQGKEHVHSQPREPVLEQSTPGAHDRFASEVLCQERGA